MTVTEYKIGYYTEFDKYAVRRRRCFSIGISSACTSWHAIGRWTNTKEEAEELIRRAEEMEKSGVEVIA